MNKQILMAFNSEFQNIFALISSTKSGTHKNALLNALIEITFKFSLNFEPGTIERRELDTMLSRKKISQSQILKMCAGEPITLQACPLCEAMDDSINPLMELMKDLKDQGISSAFLPQDLSTFTQGAYADTFNEAPAEIRPDFTIMIPKELIETENGIDIPFVQRIIAEVMDSVAKKDSVPTYEEDHAEIKKAYAQELDFIADKRKKLMSELDMLTEAEDNAGVYYQELYFENKIAHGKVS